MTSTVYQSLREVVLKGTFEAKTAEAVPENTDGKNGHNGETGEGKERVVGSVSVRDAEYGVDDGMTVRAAFGPPLLTVGGLPTVQFGPKSSVAGEVLRTSTRPTLNTLLLLLTYEHLP